MTKRNIYTLALLCFSFFSFSQERCGTTQHTKNMEAIYPQYKNAREKVNNQTKKWLENNPNHNSKETIHIPVVVHVVWNTNQENIPDSQIESQIDILNADFNRTNVDQINTPSVWQGIAADCDIEFCLAQKDPNGNATTGITRTQTSHTSFTMNNDVKETANGGIDAWDNHRYLNIWVCDLGSGLLGYATPPSNWIGATDGVVIGYKYFGNSSFAPYNKGRTATHEVGHWLNLEHVWGDNYCGNDQVSDTPTQEQENYGCPSFPNNPNSCQTNNTNGDMFMNFMDYTNDACMNLFTNGQKARMIAAINQYRSNLSDITLCEGNVGIFENSNNTKELIKIVDVLGRKIEGIKTNTPLFYIYSDGSVDKKIITE